MIHARKDYDRIQDPALFNRNLLPASDSTPIGENEPVILFRAQDKHFIDILQHYLDMLYEDSNIQSKLKEQIEDHINLAYEWRKNHKVKTPDIP